MSYPRNMAGAVALMASLSLFGLGCAVGADEQDTDADEQTIVADDAIKGEEQASDEKSGGDESNTEATGESKDAIWGLGWGGYRGFGFGYPGFGLGYRGFGFGYPGFGLGYRGFGSGYPGFGLGYRGFGFGGFGYPYYGLGC